MSGQQFNRDGSNHNNHIDIDGANNEEDDDMDQELNEDESKIITYNLSQSCK